MEKSNNFLSQSEQAGISMLKLHRETMNELARAGIPFQVVSGDINVTTNSPQQRKKAMKILQSIGQ